MSRMNNNSCYLHLSDNKGCNTYAESPFLLLRRFGEGNDVSASIPCGNKQDLKQPKSMSQRNCKHELQEPLDQTELGASFAISAATYRGAKCPTLKTAENSRKGCRVGHGKAAAKNSRKNSRNTRKTAVLTVFRLFFGCFGCFSGRFSAVFP